MGVESGLVLFFWGFLGFTLHTTNDGLGHSSPPFSWTHSDGHRRDSPNSFEIYDSSLKMAKFDTCRFKKGVIF